MPDRSPATAPAPLAARRPARTAAFVVIASVLIMATMIGSGIFLLVQRQTGTRAMARVGDCETHGSGRYRSVHCTGTWVVGGSLLDGGHVVVGTIDGVDTDSVGKTIEVTLRGDTAYARGLALPLLLILIPGFAAALCVRAVMRPRPRNRPALPG